MAETIKKTFPKIKYRIDEKIDFIIQELKEIEKNQSYQLTEQEKLIIRTAKIEELNQMILDNQAEIKNHLNILFDKVGDKTW